MEIVRNGVFWAYSEVGFLSELDVVCEEKREAEDESKDFCPEQLPLEKWPFTGMMDSGKKHV